MMEIENKGTFGVTQMFYANMGDRTINTIRDHSGKRTGPTYENEIHKGDLVKISGDDEVTKCEAGDVPIGIAVDDYDHEGQIPTTAAEWGEYENNAIVEIETFARVIKSVPLEAANSAISAGDKIKVGTTTAGCFDKGTSSNNAIALQGAVANKGGKIKVAFGIMPI